MRARSAAVWFVLLSAMAVPNCTQRGSDRCPERSAQAGSAIRDQVVRRDADCRRLEHSDAGDLHTFQRLELTRYSAGQRHQTLRGEGGETDDLGCVRTVACQRPIVLQHVDVVQFAVGETVGKLAGGALTRPEGKRFERDLDAQLLFDLARGLGGGLAEAPMARGGGVPQAGERVLE